MSETGPSPARDLQLFYEIVGGPSVGRVEALDGVLCAVVLYAMKRRASIRLHGAATRQILRNLAEFQLAWQRWKPEVYLSQVDIEVDRIIDAQPEAVTGPAIVAFSGGVDSLFTLLRNKSLPEHLGYDIGAAMLVHGFDVGLENGDAFAELVARTTRLREQTGLELRIVRTNSKELHLQRWEDSFTAELAACMHFCAGTSSVGLVGSSEPYDFLALPWGSSPVTDPLLSGGFMKVVHDGAGFSRTEKVAFISEFPEAVPTVKVCWEGPHQGKNCGECEKCVRTQLNFLAAGVEDPACFEAPLDLEKISSVRLARYGHLVELISIDKFARQHNLKGPWLNLLRKRILRGQMKHHCKTSTKHALGRAGLLPLACKGIDQVTTGIDACKRLVRA